MTDSLTNHRLYPLANPRSLAFFGASNNFSSMGTMIITALMHFGYAGEIYPVHPKETTVQGYTAYTRAEDIPAVPDLAVVVLPTAIVCETIEACGQKGIRNAIIVSGGFKETGEEGARRERELVAIAEKYGISIIGPNCLGVTNTHHRLNTTPHRYYGRPGFIGLASQSGSFVTQMFAYLNSLELGFSTAFSIGNEANTDIVDCLEYLGACPHTRVIALYVEAIHRGRQFVETARRITPRKPIVAVYVGGSETGRRAALSHTGAMSGPDDLYDGIFRQAGVIRAASITEMFDICAALGQLPAPAGSGVMVQTHSGGPGAVAADACGRAGLSLPQPGQATRDKIADLVPATGSIKNPIDITFTKDITQFFTSLPQALLTDPECHLLLLYFYLPEDMIKGALLRMGVAREKLDDKVSEVARMLCQSVRRLINDSGKPVVCFSYQTPQETATHILAEEGIPFFQGPERAVRVIRAMMEYRRAKNKINIQNS
ncbi:MAG: acetate--CoA ligase family protein [Desulfosudaceae bacterium]